MRTFPTNRGTPKKFLDYSAGLVLLIGALWPSTPAIAESKALAPEIKQAKTIYIENETKDPQLGDAAMAEFESWGRFTVTPNEADADLKIVFSHRHGMDLIGNVAFVVMDVYPKNQNVPALETKNAMKNIISPEYRTKACIREFRKKLESKH